MANYRNEFEFRSGLLNALGVEHTEADAKNEERWRSKMLDGLEVEYNQNDVNQFDLFRAKLVEGVEAKAEGGGGGSSDFSTAEVTIASTLEMTPVSVFGTFFNPNEEQVYITNPEFRVGVGHSETYSALLYQGEQIISIEGTTGSGFELDGDVELVAPEVDNEFRVYGDCTITIS